MNCEQIWAFQVLIAGKTELVKKVITPNHMSGPQKLVTGTWCPLFFICTMPTVLELT